MRNIFWSVIFLRMKPFLTCSHHKFHQGISSVDPSDPKTKENCITRMLVSRTNSLHSLAMVCLRCPLGCSSPSLELRLILTLPLFVSPRKRTETTKDSPGIHIKQKRTLFFHTCAVRTALKFEAYQRIRAWRKHGNPWPRA